ncbi:hypothetical protein [Streptomyces sp. NPDC053048]|uniref:hypothetical protein n=1 Tax=Streptomyces sp. NPDC053048 TaxID=3365694 RepID=UPI0037D0EF88
MNRQGDGRLLIVVLDPDMPPEHSPVRRALTSYHGQLVTIRPELPVLRQESGEFPTNC